MRRQVSSPEGRNGVATAWPSSSETAAHSSPPTSATMTSLLGRGSGLARLDVRRVPVPPVVRRSGRLERAVALGRLVQQLRELGGVLLLHPARQAVGDLLQLPLVAVGVREDRPAGVGVAVR